MYIHPPTLTVRATKALENTVDSETIPSTKAQFK